MTSSDEQGVTEWSNVLKPSVTNEDAKALYLTCLMYAMSYAQSTTGHFAEFLPMTHERILPHA